MPAVQVHACTYLYGVVVVVRVYIWLCVCIHQLFFMHRCVPRVCMCHLQITIQHKIFLAHVPQVYVVL